MKTLNDATSAAETRIAFLFKNGRRIRLENAGNEPDGFPREFYYGFLELERAGLPVAMMEEEDYADGAEGIVSRALTPLTHAAAGINAALVRRLGSRRMLSELNRHDVVVATTNNQGLALGLLRARGRITARVLVVAMGVLPRDAPPLRRALTRRLLREVSLAPISKSEEAYLRKALGPDHDIAYLPFGIDHRFWIPGPASGAGDYVLSIGNDVHRDYATLAAAWRPQHPKLKVVTRLAVPPSRGAIEVIAGDWNRQILSDQEVRALYQGALLVALPLVETIQPSGQSACLQAMACGKAVVISDIAGLFDRDLLVDGQTCILVPPGSPDALGDAVAGLIADPARARSIGSRARAAVAEHATVEAMAQNLRRRLDSLVAEGQSR